MSIQTLEPVIDLYTYVDLEEQLNNEERHFRSAHPLCASKIIAGSILEANCGTLYRTSAQKIPLMDVDRCNGCKKQRNTLPCPVCESFL